MNESTIAWAAIAFRALRDTCGYIENGGGDKVTIYQDDATKTWTVTVGNSRYWDYSLEGAIHKAHAVHHELIEPINKGQTNEEEDVGQRG